MDKSLRKVNGMQGCIGCNHFEHYLMIINSKLIPIFLVPICCCYGFGLVFIRWLMFIYFFNDFGNFDEAGCSCFGYITINIVNLHEH